MHHKVVTTAQYLTLIGRRMKKNPIKALTGFALATAAGLMTLIGALTVFYPVHKK